MEIARRQLLRAAGLALALPFAASPLASWAATSNRSLSVLNLHTGERLQAVYWDGGAYVPDALAGFDRVLRDHRTGEVHGIAPEVLDLAAALAARFELSEPVQIISGYRSPRTNAALHSASSGVARRSLHMEGKALDIRMPGVDLSRLRETAWSLQRGGVGFYPGSDFVHVDVGRVRQWRQG